MGRILKKRPESAPSNWQAVLTEMEINDAWSLKLEDNTADNARAAIAFGIRDTERYEFVTAVALAAYGIPADVADNSSLFHLKNYD